MAKKTATILIKLRNPETGFFYAKKKNPRSQNTTEKFKFRKYDPKLRKHVEFSESKMS